MLLGSYLCHVRAVGDPAMDPMTGSVLVAVYLVLGHGANNRCSNSFDMQTYCWLFVVIPNASCISCRYALDDVDYQALNLHEHVLSIYHLLA